MTARSAFVIAWALLVACFLAVLVPINVPSFFKLVKNGTATSATIVRLDCGNHNSAFYTFTVSGTDYSAEDMMPNDCRTLRPGDPIQIYYDVNDPLLSRATQPIGGLLNEALTIALVCLIFPPLIIMRVRHKRRTSRVKSSGR